MWSHHEAGLLRTKALNASFFDVLTPVVRVKNGSLFRVLALFVHLSPTSRHPIANHISGPTAGCENLQAESGFPEIPSCREAMLVLSPTPGSGGPPRDKRAAKTIVSPRRRRFHSSHAPSAFIQILTKVMMITSIALLRGPASAVTHPAHLGKAEEVHVKRFTMARSRPVAVLGSGDCHLPGGSDVGRTRTRNTESITYRIIY